MTKIDFKIMNKKPLKYKVGDTVIFRNPIYTMRNKKKGVVQSVYPNEDIFDYAVLFEGEEKPLAVHRHEVGDH